MKMKFYDKQDTSILFQKYVRSFSVGQPFDRKANSTALRSTKKTVSLQEESLQQIDLNSQETKFMG